MGSKTKLGSTELISYFFGMSLYLAESQTHISAQKSTYWLPKKIMALYASKNFIKLISVGIYLIQIRNLSEFSYML